MANIAGGYAAVGALEGARDYRQSEAQNIQNQSNQIDLDTKRDMMAGYEAYANAVAKKRQREAAQIPSPGQAAPSALSGPSGEQPPAPAQQQPEQQQPEQQAPPSAMSGGPAPAPQSQPAPAAGPDVQAPAPAPVKIDPQTEELAKRFGLNVSDIAGVKMTPGFMQGMTLAAQHREEQAKEGMKQGINRMARVLSMRSDADQREGV